MCQFLNFNLDHFNSCQQKKGQICSSVPAAMFFEPRKKKRKIVDGGVIDEELRNEESENELEDDDDYLQNDDKRVFMIKIQMKKLTFLLNIH